MSDIVPERYKDRIIDGRSLADKIKLELKERIIAR
jgi:hypothetical protein